MRTQTTVYFDHSYTKLAKMDNSGENERGLDPKLVEFGCVMKCSVDNLVLNLELVGDPPVHGKQRTESVQAVSKSSSAGITGRRSTDQLSLGWLVGV